MYQPTSLKVQRPKCGEDRGILLKYYNVTKNLKLLDDLKKLLDDAMLLSMYAAIGSNKTNVFAVSTRFSLLSFW